MNISFQEKEKYEAVVEDHDTQDMILKDPTRVDVEADSKKIGKSNKNEVIEGNKDKNGKNGGNKSKEKEVVMVKKRKPLKERTEASQKI